MDVHASDVDGDPHRAMAGRNGSLPMQASDSDGRTIASVATGPREPWTALSGPRVGKTDRPMTRAAEGFGDAGALGIDRPAEGRFLALRPGHTPAVSIHPGVTEAWIEMWLREQPTTEA